MSPDHLPDHLRKRKLQAHKPGKFIPKTVGGQPDPDVKLIGHIRAGHWRREVYAAPGYARASLRRLVKQWEGEHPLGGAAEDLKGRIAPDGIPAAIPGPMFVAEQAHRTIMMHPRFEPVAEPEKVEGILAGWIYTSAGHREVRLCKNPRAACDVYSRAGVHVDAQWSVDSLWDSLGRRGLWDHPTLHPLFLGTNAMRGFIGHPKFVPKEPIKEEPKKVAKEEAPKLVMCGGCNLAVGDCKGAYLKCPNSRSRLDAHQTEKAIAAAAAYDARTQAPYPDDVAEAGY